MPDDVIDMVLRAARDAVRNVDRPLLLAVSGGLDSMTLLHALAEVAPSRIAAVATFDHGTGAAAQRAVAHVRASAGGMGLPFVTERFTRHGEYPDGREAAWRAARYQFLCEAAERVDGVVVTAHTEDDQVETVLLRILRGSGARGLAGLYTTRRVFRPLVRVTRAAVESYAVHRGVQWVEDPSNGTRDHARNRVRLDLLPALRRVRPEFHDEILTIARRADALRCDVEAYVDHTLRPRHFGDGSLVVASRGLRGYDASSHAVLWPALAGRAGLVLDARGIRRIASFASLHPSSGIMPLAGGWCLEATRDTYILSRDTAAAASLAPVTLPEAGSIAWGRFHFRVVGDPVADSAWGATISLEECAVIRQWTAGDRLEASGGQQPRRVKRYLSDAGVRGSARTGWPVVVAGHDIVWIPGVRRSDAATDRSGRPARHYICERIDR